MIKYTGNLRLDFEKATEEITKLKDRILEYQEQVASLQASVRNLKKSRESEKKLYAESLAEKDAIIKELQSRLAHAEALLNHDGSNTGIPTSQTQINKNKVVYYYECNNCGTIFRSQIPPGLKEKAQYGSGLQALALSLTNTVNAAMNKASMFLAGITGGELTPCDGYIAKLQARAANGLRQFREDLKLVLITRKIVYWDDTVIFILTQRACFRFYGDESIAYYTAHAHKDMEGLDDDNVLNLLTSDTKAMHDHNTVNYNDKYSFENIECNQHLQRDCQKNTDDTCHQWSDDLKKLISATIKDRNVSIAQGEESFSEAYVSDFHRKVDECLENGWKENAAAPSNYGAPFERTLLTRIAQYRRNYFLWVEDFSLPTTNNFSERGFRGIKSHMKISGQFESEAAADNHALNRTYIEIFSTSPP